MTQSMKCCSLCNNVMVSVPLQSDEGRVYLCTNNSCKCLELKTFKKDVPVTIQTFILPIQKYNLVMQVLSVCLADNRKIADTFVQYHILQGLEEVQMSEST